MLILNLHYSGAHTPQVNNLEGRRGASINLTIVAFSFSGELNPLQRGQGQKCPCFLVTFLRSKNNKMIHKFIFSLGVCRLHTAFLHWPLSSAATKKVQGPDTT